MSRFVPTSGRSGSRYTQRALAFAMLCCLAGGSAYADEDDRIKIGAGVAVIPRFEGSNDYRALPVPIIDIQNKSFYVRTDDGVGLNLIHNPAFTVGVGLNLMQGYRERDVPYGIGKLSDGVGARVSFSTNLLGAVFEVSGTQAVKKKDRGMIINSRISYPYAVIEQLMLVPSFSVNWANAKYMDSYFGVNSEQSAMSGKSQYHPTSGFKDTSVRLAVSYSLSKNFSLSGSVGAVRILDQAADSPLVEKQSSLRAVVGGVYTF